MKSGDVAFVYETSPTSKVVGRFLVGRVITGTPSETAIYAEGDTVDQIRAYLLGAETSTAIEILGPTRFVDPIPLAVFAPGLSAPQSYVFLRR